VGIPYWVLVRENHLDNIQNPLLIRALAFADCIFVDNLRVYRRLLEENEINPQCLHLSGDALKDMLKQSLNHQGSLHLCQRIACLLEMMPKRNMAET
ncbi:MAG: hypothetical protein VKJ24_14515, partial [Synechococcales bacterium]|nr:hypothetical protein [Synechococcales bacterium]